MDDIKSSGSRPTSPGRVDDMELIINELLCYLLAKIDSVPTDVLIRLVSENFSDSEVDNAKSLLCQHVEDSIRAGVKRGQNKKKHDMDDIVKMLVQCDRSALPRFVALDLGKLPPISIDCIDVSSLMRKQQLQDVEIANLKSLVHEILTVTTETSKRVELGLLSDKGSSVMGAASRTTSGSEASSSSSGPSVGSPALSSEEPPPDRVPAPSYAEVARDAIANHDASEWAIANRKKRAKAPTPRKPTVAAGAASGPSSETQQTRSTANRTVIGSRSTGPIKAVAVVKRLSIFMSRLPPGTGEEAVKAYAMEQTGAVNVIASKLQTKYDGYESYRLDIINPSCDDVLEPELWAQGLVVRRFFTRRQTSSSEKPTAGKATSALRPEALQ